MITSNHKCTIESQKVYTRFNDVPVATNDISLVTNKPTTSGRVLVTYATSFVTGDKSLIMGYKPFITSNSSFVACRVVQLMVASGILLLLLLVSSSSHWLPITIRCITGSQWCITSEQFLTSGTFID